MQRNHGVFETNILYFGSSRTGLLGKQVFMHGIPSAWPAMARLAACPVRGIALFGPGLFGPFGPGLLALFGPELFSWRCRLSSPQTSLHVFEHAFSGSARQRLT